MRTFGTDAPEFMSFKLGDGETVYQIPLASSMPMSELNALGKETSKGGDAATDAELALLRKYIGPIADELTAATVLEIFAAWLEESTKQGATLGE